MSNTSATGGYLLPESSPAPLQDQDLFRFLQQFIVNVTGLSGSMVRPRYQTESPNIPTEGTVWCSFGYNITDADTYPYVGHDSTGDGSAVFMRNESIVMLCSFYDQGYGGLADTYAALLRDGIFISQNREVLKSAGLNIQESGDMIKVPSLLKQLWLNRVDLTLTLRRKVIRVYPVLNLLSTSVEIATDVGLPTTTITISE